MLVLLYRLLSWIKAQAICLLLAILASGPVPRHIAFVMDGNRRYARGRRMDVRQGHVDGFASLRRVLEVCLRLKIHCVSVYAFSIENFKRPDEEVEALMKLAREGLLELSEQGDLLDQYEVRVNVIGRRSLLPIQVQEAVGEVERRTRHHERAILNICMPYTSRDEITSAIEDTVNGVIAAGTNFEITEHLIESNLSSTQGGSPPLDILVRTSGVRRLSDYMLWQCCDETQLQFISTYWPDFGFRHFLPIIFDYQLKTMHNRQECAHLKST